MKKIVKSFCIVAIISLATRGLSFLYKIVISRNLTDIQLGLYQSGIGVFMVLLTITSSGLPLAVSRLTSECEDKEKRRPGKLLAASCVIAVVFSALSALLIVLGKNFLENLFADKSCYGFLISLLPALFASSLYSSFRGSLWGKASFSYSLFQSCWKKSLPLLR